MHALQIVTLLVSAAGSRGQNLDANGRPKCCADSLSPLARQESWLDVLRQATYQSVIRHLDYTGTLDGRLDRDHALWKLLRQARYIGEAKSDINTGALIERPDTDRIDFEFRQEDRSVFDCARIGCGGINGSVIALWRVRNVDDPYELWITVKVPKLGDGKVEDVYKYGAKLGLQKLNPDPLQLKSVKGENHRFFISKTRGEKKLMPRMDFMFPGESKSKPRMDFMFPGESKSKSFGVGRVAPPPFAYESPVLSGRSINGWAFAARKPHPGVVLDAGLRNQHQGPVFNPLLGPFIAEGPQGYRHVIYSLPSIVPPQKLDSQDARGFLPSTGPIIGSPLLQSELPFRTHYAKYYNERPAQYITPPPFNFNPSKEFVRYSELDPLYHSEGEPELLHTSQTPDRNVPMNTITFPSSVNDVLPTVLPLVPTKQPMQIIVKVKNITTIKPIMTSQPSTFQKPKTRISEKPASKSNTNSGDKNLTKVFGEKIKPKNSTTIKPWLSTDGKLKYTTKSPLTHNIFRNKSITGYPKYSNKDSTLPTTVVNNSNAPTEANIDQQFNRYTTPSSDRKTESTETNEQVDIFTEFTTEEIKKQTTYFDVDATTESNEYESGTSIFVTEPPTKEKEVVENTLKTKETMIVGLKPYQGQEAATHPSKINDPENTSDVYDDYYTDETTDAPVDLTTVETYDPETTKSTETDFFPTLTDALFAIETTTQTTNKTTTITPKENLNQQNADAETQESQHQRIQYRLLTFPGDSVSIVANRISKSVSYRTADGKERKLQHKLPTSSVDRYSTRLGEYYDDYSTIL